MITGFEKYTHELAKHELQAMKVIAQNLKDHHRGKHNAVSNRKIRRWINKNMAINISDPRMRKIMHVMRVSGMVKRLIANGKGYYVAMNIGELREYYASISERISHQEKIRQVVANDIKEIIEGKQEGIPF